MTAAKIAASICKNADRYWNHEIGYEAFTAEARRLWDRAHEAGLTSQVSALLPVNNRN